MNPFTEDYTIREFQNRVTITLLKKFKLYICKKKKHKRILRHLSLIHVQCTITKINKNVP